MGKFSEFVKTARDGAALVGSLWTGAVAIFAWIAKKTSAFGPLGWPESILIGVLIAAVLLMSAGALLAGWRYFRPLASLPASEEAIEQQEHYVTVAMMSAMQDDYRRQVEGLQRTIDAQAGRLLEVARFTTDREYSHIANGLRQKISDQIAIMAEIIKSGDKTRSAHFGISEVDFETPLTMLGYDLDEVRAFVEKARQRIMGDAQFLFLAEGEDERWASGHDKRRWFVHGNVLHAYRQLLDALEPRHPDIRRFLTASSQMEGVGPFHHQQVST